MAQRYFLRSYRSTVPGKAAPVSAIKLKGTKIARDTSYRTVAYDFDSAVTAKTRTKLTQNRQRQSCKKINGAAWNVPFNHSIYTHY